jgi:hypothetical protein
MKCKVNNPINIFFSFSFRSKEILIQGNYKLNYSAGGSAQNTLKTISVKKTKQLFFSKSAYPF